MTSRLAMRWMLIFGIGMVPLAVTAAAQQAPANTQGQQQDSITSQPGQRLPAMKQSLVSAAPANTKTAANSSSKTVPAAAPVAFQSRTDKLSYAFGVTLARDLQRQKNSFNVDMLMRALTDTLAGKDLIMSNDEVAATLKTFEVEQKHDLEHARIMVSERNRREGEAFFAENAKEDGVVTLPSGLQYKVLKKGDGKVPAFEDVVVCNYVGKLLDGTEIDSSFKRKEPTAMPVNSVIPGWAQALLLMPVGSKWQLFIPPQLAYGDQATSAFGPNATLIFEVELLAIQDKGQRTVSAAR